MNYCLFIITRWVWRDHSANTNDVTECFGLQPQGNRKVSHRRVTVLNSVFYERITDLLSTSEIDDGLQDMNFFVTKVLLHSFIIFAL